MERLCNIYQRSEVTIIGDINHDTTAVAEIPAEASALPNQLHWWSQNHSSLTADINDAGRKVCIWTVVTYWIVSYTYTAVFGLTALKALCLYDSPQNRSGGARHGGLGAKPPFKVTVSKILRSSFMELRTVRTRAVLLKVTVHFALVRTRNERK